MRTKKEIKEGGCFPPMGCRSVLSPFYNSENNQKWYGRFNQGVVTINLPYIALLSDGNNERFYKELDKYLDICKKALLTRHKRLKGTISDVAPILWQHGAISRLNKGETIDKLLYDGYSTISLGYAGLYETTKHMTGETHTGKNGKIFAVKLMKYLYNKCEYWKKETNIGFGLYGTPLESATYKFAKSLQNRFGIIKGITDKNYVTNSYHVHVTENIDAFSKLEFESQFQEISTGGSISYIEVPDISHNIESVIQIIQFIYEHIMYAEINSKFDYCHCCGYDGEIKIIEDNSKLIWECPNCNNKDQTKMNVTRRTCGYLGSNFWNQGRTAEIKDRVYNLGVE